MIGGHQSKLLSYYLGSFYVHLIDNRCNVVILNLILQQSSWRILTIPTCICPNVWRLCDRIWSFVTRHLNDSLTSIFARIVSLMFGEYVWILHRMCPTMKFRIWYQIKVLVLYCWFSLFVNNRLDGILVTILSTIDHYPSNLI